MEERSSTRFGRATGGAQETRAKFRAQMLRAGSADDREIELKVQGRRLPTCPTSCVPGMPGAQMGMLPQRHLGRASAGDTKTRRHDGVRGPTRC